LLCFFISGLNIPQVHASDFYLPAPGVMVRLSPPVDPAILKGLKVHPDNPLRFDFILNQGDARLSSGQIKDQSVKLIKYFLAGLTTPEKDLWVNLSPYEKDRVIPNSFGLTEMGRDILAEDYMLKQITASLIYPEDAVGKKFWQRIYAQAAKKYGTTDIPVNTFNKVWIVPQTAVVYENAQTGTAYVVESKLKVMLEQDYLSMSKHQGSAANASALGSQVVREIVLPQLTIEVNENKNFAKLRQVYNSLILATWYKKKIKDSILAQVYEDKNKTAGVNIDDPKEKERIYQRYLQAFKKGVYNYIKEDTDPVTREMIPRKYFSGGVDFAMSGATNLQTGFSMKFVHSFDPAQSSNELKVTADLAMFSGVLKGVKGLLLGKPSNGSTMKEIINNIDYLTTVKSDAGKFRQQQWLLKTEQANMLNDLKDLRAWLNKMGDNEIEVGVSGFLTTDGKWAWYAHSGQEHDVNMFFPEELQKANARRAVFIHSHPVRTGEQQGWDEIPSFADLKLVSKYPGTRHLIMVERGLLWVESPDPSVLHLKDGTTFAQYPDNKNFYEALFEEWLKSPGNENRSRKALATQHDFLRYLYSGTELKPDSWNDMTKLSEQWQETVGKKQDSAMLVKVGDTDAQYVLDRVEIHGGTLSSGLSAEDIRYLGMSPKYKIEQGGRTIYFSAPYQVGKNWVAVLGYVRDGNTYVARTYYTSGSQALWRYLPRVTFNDENKIAWFDKGYSEDSLPLPYQIQKFLGQVMDQEKPKLLQESEWTLLFAGTTNDQARTYKATIEPSPQKVTFKDDPGAVGGYIAPEGLDFGHPSDRPDFGRMLDNYTFISPVYGSLITRVFPSGNGKYKFTFMEDRKGRCWIANIETNGPLNTLGLSASWVKGGSFTVPAYEYAEQSYGYGNFDDVVYKAGTTRVRYVDMWKNYLSKVPIIKEFHSRFVLQNDEELPDTVVPETETVTAQPRVKVLTWKEQALINWSGEEPVLLKVGNTLVKINEDRKGYFGVRVSSRNGEELSRRVYFEGSLDLGREGATNRFKMNGVVSTARVDPDVSRQHARVIVRENQLIIEDLGSTHGTRYAEGELTPDLLKDLMVNANTGQKDEAMTSTEWKDYQALNNLYHSNVEDKVLAGALLSFVSKHSISPQYIDFVMIDNLKRVARGEEEFYRTGRTSGRKSYAGTLIGLIYRDLQDRKQIKNKPAPVIAQRSALLQLADSYATAKGLYIFVSKKQGSVYKAMPPAIEAALSNIARLLRSQDRQGIKYKDLSKEERQAILKEAVIQANGNWQEFAGFIRGTFEPFVKQQMPRSALALSYTGKLDAAMVSSATASAGFFSLTRAQKDDVIATMRRIRQLPFMVDSFKKNLMAQWRSPLVNEAVEKRPSNPFPAFVVRGADGKRYEGQFISPQASWEDTETALKDELEKYSALQKFNMAVYRDPIENGEYRIVIVPSDMGDEKSVIDFMKDIHVAVQAAPVIVTPTFTLKESKGWRSLLSPVTKYLSAIVKNKFVLALDRATIAHREPQLKGGIDLTPANMHLQTRNSGAEIKFHLDPALLQRLQNAPGFTPVIVNIQPLTDLRGFLGLTSSISHDIL